MYETPEFVKWVDDDLVNEAKKNVLEKYTIQGINADINLEDLSLHELRELATFNAELGYDHDTYNSVGYNRRQALADKLNKEFNRRLGEQAVSVYNILDRKHNTEKWGGEVRYVLMNLCNRKGYTELSVLKNTVWYMHLVGKGLTADMANELMHIMNHTLYWKFGCEKGLEGRFDESPEMFEKFNEARKEEIKTQDKFIDYCLEQKFEEAYKLIEAEVYEVMHKK